MNKNLAIGVVAALALLLGLIGVLRPAQTITQVTEGTPQPGSVTGPDSYFPYRGLNDVRTYSERKKFNSASTTICSFKSPAATSTLVFGSAQVGVATGTAVVIDFAQATVMDATTTAIGSTNTLASGAKVTLVASTSPLTATAGDRLIFSPNTYFNVKFGAAGIGSTHLLGGQCEATFIEN